MPIIDFKEISEAHLASGKQDSFEFFARDFLKFLGFNIIEGPDRGLDGGRDLIVLEIRSGIGGETRVNWLVSCKHKAHSGKSVILDDETDILERVSAKGCQGFLGFYSTIPSSSLSSRLEGLRPKIEIKVFDKESIESNLLHSSKGLELAKRYFPKSISTWVEENPKPATIFADQQNLKCDYCGKDLLETPEGNITMWETVESNEQEKSKREIIDVYWCCKGNCDRVLENRYVRRYGIDAYGGWEDISDLCIPLVYIRMLITIINQQNEGMVYSKTALDKIKEFSLTLFPYVSRQVTSKEKERIAGLMRIPAVFGGLG